MVQYAKKALRRADVKRNGTLKKVKKNYFSRYGTVHWNQGVFSMSIKILQTTGTVPVFINFKKSHSQIRKINMRKDRVKNDKPKKIFQHSLITKVLTQFFYSRKRYVKQKSE